MFKIEDNSLILNPLIKQVKTPFNIPFDTALGGKEDNVKEHLSRAIKRFYTEYNISVLESDLAREGFIIEDRPKHNTRIAKIKVNPIILSASIVQLRKDLGYFQNESINAKHNVAQGLYFDETGVYKRLHTLHMHTAKYDMLASTLLLFKQLETGEVTEVYMRQTPSIIRHYLNTLQSYLGKNNYRIKNKNHGWQYDTLRVKNTKDIIDKQIQSSYEYARDALNIPFDYSTTIEFSFAKEEAAVDIVEPVKIDLAFLYPNLNKDLGVLASSLLENFKTPSNEMLSSERLISTWLTFNNIKVNLMLSGFDEAKAVEYICSTHPKLKEQGVERCAITEQLVPSIFIVPVILGNEKSVRANLYYLDQQNYSMRSRSSTKESNRYSVKEGIWRENKKLTDRERHYATVYNHKKNILDFLTPQVAKHEKIEPYNEHKGYRPIPYLGVELEVERKAADTYPVPFSADTIVLPTGRTAEYDAAQNTWRGIDAATAPRAPDAPATLCDENITEYVLDTMGRDFCMVKHDGTLGGHLPFEMVTVPATITQHKERWLPFMTNKEIKGQLQSFKSGKCGMHVHISRNSFTGLHLAKFMRFINCETNHKFMTAIAQRNSNSYAEYTKTLSVMDSARALLDGHTRGYDGRGHYKAVNISNAKTIEVRIFRGNLSTVQFFKNLEFVHAAWQFTLEASINGLGYKDFLFWLFDPQNHHHNLYANLEKWLVKSDAKSLFVTTPIRQSTSPEEKARLIERRKAVKKLKLMNERKYKAKKKTTETDEEILQSA